MVNPISLTAESHIYTLLNCIFESGIPTVIQRNELQEIDYLTQVSFEVWERTTTPPSISSPTSLLPTLSTFSPPSSRITSAIHSPVPSSFHLPPVRGGTPPFPSSPVLPPSSGTSSPSVATQSNYSLRIGFSPGCTVSDPLDTQLDSKHCINVAPRRPLTNHLDVDVIRDLLEKKFGRVNLPKRFLPVNIMSNQNSSDVSEEMSDVGSTRSDTSNH